MTAERLPGAAGDYHPGHGAKHQTSAAITVSIAAAGPSTSSTRSERYKLAQFINNAGLQSHRRQSACAETSASGAPITGTPGTNGAGTLQQGLMSRPSNANVVEEMVNTIQTRAYLRNEQQGDFDVGSNAADAVAALSGSGASRMNSEIAVD